jgi:hypothetical protein
MIGFGIRTAATDTYRKVKDFHQCSAREAFVVVPLTLDRLVFAAIIVTIVAFGWRGRGFGLQRQLRRGRFR